MIDFIPIHNYTYYFDITILCMIIVAVWQCHTGNVLQKNIVNLNAMWGVIFTLVLIPYMGLRPVSGVFGDTINYAKEFYEIQRSREPFTWIWEKEWLFHNLMQLFAKISNIHYFFLTCATIYVGCFWLAMKRIFKDYYYIPLLIVFCMFTFWSFGVNGIRNGMGAALFTLAITYVRNPLLMIGLCILGYGCHNSVLLMIGAGIVGWFLKNSKYYLIVWCLCIAISYLAGLQIQNYIAALDLFPSDERFSGYLTGENIVGEIVQMEMTFRWDYLIYSALGVATGYYFIFIRKFNDEYYHWIFNMFLMTNAFWILIIRATYSNRFAQISWFIMPLVLIYPFLKQRFWVNHEKMMGYAILLFYVFSFYYNILK